MKKLLFIFSLALFSCSAEEMTEEAVEMVEVKEFYLILHEECTDKATAYKFQVVEDTYYSVIRSHEMYDCDTHFNIPDVNREKWYEGYLWGEEIVTKTVSQ